MKEGSCSLVQQGNRKGQIRVRVTKREGKNKKLKSSESERERVIHSERGKQKKKIKQHRTRPHSAIGFERARRRMEDLWWSSDSDGEIENKDFFPLLGKLEKLDEKKWGVGESDTEDFYKIMVEADAMAQSLVNERFLTKTMAENLKCLVRGEKQTIRLLNHFNFCFRFMSSTFSEFGNALSLNERHIPTEEKMIKKLGACATVCGGSKIIFNLNKMKEAFEDGNLGGVRSELIKAKAEMGVLSDKLDDYFKLGVKLGLPTATCSVKRITESSSKTVEPRGLKRTGESSSEMVEPSLKRAAGESSSVTRDDSQPNNETVGDE